MSAAAKLFGVSSHPEAKEVKGLGVSFFVNHWSNSVRVSYTADGTHYSVETNFEGFFDKIAEEIFAIKEKIL